MDFMDTLRTLLSEVYDFLSKDVLMGHPNENVKSKARLLMKQVMNVKDQACLMNDGNSYVDMTKKSIINKMADEKPENHIHHDLPMNYEEKVVMRTEDCPYKNALISELTPVKSGSLRRRETFFSILRGNREYFVVLLDEWLLFYNSSKKTQAQEIYQRETCKAMDLEDKGTLFTLNIEDKAFTMSADSRKEKVQWISAVSDIAAYKKTLGLDDKVIKLKHISIESNESNVYAEVDDNQRDDSSSSIKRMPLPDVPIEHNNVNNNQNQNGDASDYDGIYQFAALQRPEYINEFDDHLHSATDSKVEYVFATTQQQGQEQDTIPSSQDQNEFGAPPEENYTYALNGCPEENIYESVERLHPLPEPVEDRHSMRPKPAVPMRKPVVAAKKPPPPPPPKETRLLDELKLRQKLSKTASINERGTSRNQ